MLYYTIMYCTILYYTLLYYTILQYIILYYTLVYYTILYHTILCYTILCYTTVLCPTTLYCTRLHCIILRTIVATLSPNIRKLSTTVYITCVIVLRSLRHSVLTQLPKVVKGLRTFSLVVTWNKHQRIALALRELSSWRLGEWLLVSYLFQS